MSSYLIFHAFKLKEDVYTPEYIAKDLNEAIAWIKEHCALPYIGRYFIAPIERPIAVKVRDGKIFLD